MNTEKLRRYLKGIMLALVVGVFTWSCSDPIEEVEVVKPSQEEVNTNALPPGGGVMMQAFYWNVPAGGNWWNTVKGKVNSWSSAGITALWLPPASKAQNGGYSMGYDPADYYDFGNFNQHGSTETRFGSKNELTSLISQAHNRGMQVYADIVINHNSGGASEWNPYANKYTYTDYNPASGLFYRSYNDFHPNLARNSDEGVFGGFADLSHVQPYVQDWLWKRSNSVGKYYKNTMKFDGWRFDFVKGFGGWVVKDWVDNVGGFSVGELWDGNANNLQNWINSTSRRSSAFDFACYYKMSDAFNGNNLNALTGDMLLKRDPSKAVTFVANHDTDIIYKNKLNAYAFILTHEGYPTIFYRDYEEWLPKSKLNNLIWIHGQKAVGSTSVLYSDNDEYIAQRNGNPGLVVYINNSGSWKERWVQTKFNGKRIKDFTGHSSWEPVVQSNGWVKIQVPPNSYTVWSQK